MAQPIIQKTGSISGPSSAGQGSNDLVAGEQVSLADVEAANSGATYFWEFEDYPIGTTPVMVNETTATPHFFVDSDPALAGSYRVKCTVDGVEFSTEVFAKPLSNTGARIPSFQEQEEYDEAGNPVGWHEAQTIFMRTVDDRLGSAKTSNTERQGAIVVPVGNSTKTIDLGGVMYPGSVIAVSGKLTLPVIGGSIAVRFKVNGVTKLTATLSTGAPTFAYTTEAAGVHPILEADLLTVEVEGISYANSGGLPSELAITVSISNSLDNAPLSIPDASNTTKGVTKLSVAPAVATEPVAVGTNDGRVPSQDENDALAGTTGLPSSVNPYVTDQDPRNTNSRSPLTHTIGGAAHSASTLADLNTKISDATLDDSANPRTPTAHKTSHQNGGGDEISVAGLSGLLADAQTPLAHASTHQNGGLDEISVAGLSGLLADSQTPLAHAASHADGGSDELTVQDLGSGAIAADLLIVSDGAGGWSTISKNGLASLQNVVDVGNTVVSTSGSGISITTSGTQGVLVTTSSASRGIDIAHGSSGRAISVAATAVAGAVDAACLYISSSVNQTNVPMVKIESLSVAQNLAAVEIVLPTLGATGGSHGLYVLIGGNQNGTGVQVVHNGTASSNCFAAFHGAGRGIYVYGSDTGTGFELSCAGSGQGVVVSGFTHSGGLVDISGTSGSGPILFVERGAGATGNAVQINNILGNNANHCLEINNSSTSSSSDSIEINHSGLGTGIDLNCTNTSQFNSALAMDYYGTGDALYIGLWSTTTTPSAIQITETASSTRTADLISVSCAGVSFTGDVLGISGPGGSIWDIHSDLSVRIHCNGSPVDGFVFNVADGGMAGGDTVFVLATDDALTGFRWMECIGSLSNLRFRMEDGGGIYTDDNIYSTPADYAENFAPVLDKSNYEPGDVIVISGNDLVDKSSSPSQTSVLGVYSTAPAFLGNSGPGGGDMTGGTLEPQAYSWQQSKGPSSSFDKIEIDTDRTADYPIDSLVRMDQSNVAMKVKSATYNSGLDKTTVKFDQTWQNDPGTPDLYYGVPERNVIPVGLLGQVPTKCITENGSISPGDMLVTSSTAGYAMKAPPSPAIGTIIGKSLGTLTDTGSGTDTDVLNVLVNPT